MLAIVLTVFALVMFAVSTILSIISLIASKRATQAVRDAEYLEVYAAATRRTAKETERILSQRAEKTLAPL